MNKESRQEVFKRLHKTKSLRAIGKQFGISGERVRQVIKGEEKEDVEKLVNEQYIKNLDKILKNHLFDEIERLSVPDRRKEIVLQRRALVKKLREHYKLSFPQIGFLLKRDHTTIINLYYGRK